MLNVTNLSKSYGSMPIVSGVSFGIGTGSKVALIGSNGSGKSTLLRILAGVESADRGLVKYLPGVRVGYLPQIVPISGEETVLEYIKSAIGLTVLENEMAAHGSLLDTEAQSRYVDAQDAWLRLEGDSIGHRSQVMMSGFGLPLELLNTPMTTLSGGQKTKVAMSALLLGQYDLLLLDEPTNNLDLPALIWLEQYLREAKESYLIVSHDRRFLDLVATKVMEIDRDRHTLIIRNGTYSDYLRQQEQEFNAALDEFGRQKEEVQRLQRRAREQKEQAKAGSRQKTSDNDKQQRGAKRDRSARVARAAKSLERRIEQMSSIDRPIEREPLVIELEPFRGHQSAHITCTDVTAGYPGFCVGPVTISIAFGDRIALMGLNGSGKSTLIKVLAGELLPLSGSVRRGAGTRIGNLVQELSQVTHSETIMGFLKKRVHRPEHDYYNALVKFGIDRDRVHELVTTLSPGNRTRLTLALFTLQAVTTLILDEPTNHLDIEAIQALETALVTYPGTVIVVSHDRFFLERCHLNDYYELVDGQLRRLDDFEAYIAAAETQAKRTLALL